MKTGYRVADVMTTKPICITKETSLKDAAFLMKKYNVNSLIVKEGEKAIGIFIDEDLVRKVISNSLNPAKLKAKDIMEKGLITIHPDRDIYDALILMREYNIRQLPVIKGEKLVGFLTLKDILKIEPELFDLIVEKYELREESRKPIMETTAEEGICELCAKYSDKIKLVKGSLVCPKCANKV